MEVPDACEGLMIATETHGDVTVVRLEHGPVNALDLDLCRAITAAFRELADSAVVLTGAGRAFSAGVDLKRLVAGGPEYVDEYLPALSDAFLAVFDHPRPVIAAINGHAIAGGCVIAAGSDVRLMASGGIGLTELAVGVPFPIAALEIMRYAAGPGVNRLVLSGPVLAPPDALASGLVDEVMSPEKLLDRALEQAGELAAVPAATYRLTKEQLHRPARERIDAWRRDDDARVAGIWRSTDALSGIRYYMERLGT